MARFVCALVALSVTLARAQDDTQREMMELAMRHAWFSYLSPDEREHMRNDYRACRTDAERDAVLDKYRPIGLPRLDEDVKQARERREKARFDEAARQRAMARREARTHWGAPRTPYICNRADRPLDLRVSADGKKYWTERLDTDEGLFLPSVRFCGVSDGPVIELTSGEPYAWMIDYSDEERAWLPRRMAIPISGQGTIEIPILAGPDTVAVMGAIADGVHDKLASELKKLRGKPIEDWKFGSIDEVKAYQRIVLTADRVNEMLAARADRFGFFFEASAEPGKRPTLWAKSEIDRLRKFWRAHGSDPEHCVGIMMRFDVVNLIYMPTPFSDADFRVQLRLMFRWRVEGSTLVFEVDDLKHKHDFYAYSGHRVLHWFEWHSIGGAPAAIGRRLQDRLRKEVDLSVLEARLGAAFPVKVSIGLEDLRIEPDGTMIATVKWRIS